MRGLEMVLDGCDPSLSRGSEQNSKEKSHKRRTNKNRNNQNT